MKWAWKWSVCRCAPLHVQTLSDLSSKQISIQMRILPHDNLIFLFWVNSVYLSCCFNRKFFSIGIDIKFDIWLNIICS